MPPLATAATTRAATVTIRARMCGWRRCRGRGGVAVAAGAAATPTVLAMLAMPATVVAAVIVTASILTTTVMTTALGRPVFSLRRRRRAVARRARRAAAAARRAAVLLPCPARITVVLALLRSSRLPVTGLLRRAAPRRLRFRLLPRRFFRLDARGRLGLLALLNRRQVLRLAIAEDGGTLRGVRRGRRRAVHRPLQQLQAGTFRFPPTAAGRRRSPRGARNAADPSTPGAAPARGGALARLIRDLDGNDAAQEVVARHQQRLA